MCSGEGFRALFMFCILARWCEAAPLLQDEALQQLGQLNLTQAKLIADNSSVKCSLTPNLCDWQLHLYEGHGFSVPLVQAVESPPTRAPSKAGQEIFGLGHQDSGGQHQLFILADIEPKSRRKLRRKRKLRRRVALNHLSKQKFVLLVVQ